LMWSLNKIEEDLRKLEDHDCQVKCCSQIMRTIRRDSSLMICWKKRGRQWNK
jgi:hypothetical protein